MQDFLYMIAFLVLLIIIECNPEQKRDIKLRSIINQEPDVEKIVNASEGEMAYSSESKKISGINFSASCFLYHRFNESKYPSTSIPADLFEEHLKYLVENEYSVITLGELFKIQDSMPEGTKMVILTIDDAFRSFYEHGFPLLKKYGLKATLFVNSATIGMGDFSGWNELKEMHLYGIEIGNHTDSHAYFLNDPPSERREKFSNDVMLAQDSFRKNLDIECRVFSYPYGEYDDTMKEIIREKGFFCAAAQNSGVISSYSDQYALPRFPMTGDYGQMTSFREKVKMLALPVIRIEPSTTIPEKNPPELKVWFTDPGLDLERMQGFVQGGKSELTFTRGDTVMVTLTSTSKLGGRRHLYTLTSPHHEPGKWYWFSHQWVFPDVK